MVTALISKLLDINWLARWRLEHQAGQRGGFICRGSIQLSLEKTAQIKPPQQPCLIGIPILGNATPRRAVTVIAINDGAEVEWDGACIGRGAIISVGSQARLTIGQNSYVTGTSLIAAQQSITIGQNCAISWGVTIIDDDGHGFGPPPYSAPIEIQDNVWIGCNATILKGVTLGRGSAIAAGAVVTRSCPPNSLLAGVPARVIRENICWTDQARLTQPSAFHPESLTPPPASAVCTELADR